MTPDAYDSAPPRGTPLTWTRVYRRYGRYAHLELDGQIACRSPRRETSWMGDAWLGTGSQEEYEKAASLPLHPRCFAVREAARVREGHDPAGPVGAAVTALPALTRPDGRTYRPRKLAAYAVTDPDDGDTITGVVVLGTHDPAAAQPVADAYARWQLGSRCTAVSPVAVWWRHGYACGRLGWVTDEAGGRAGVFFSEIVERYP